MTVVRQDTVLPGGGLPAACVVTDDDGRDVGVVRYGGTLIALHPGRMTQTEARVLGAALFELAAEGTSAE